MPRATKKSAAPRRPAAKRSAPTPPSSAAPAAGSGEPGGPSSVSDLQADGGAGAEVRDDNEHRSEQVMVVAPTEEPVRCGGHVLTEDGWVLEDGPDPAEDAESDSAEQEQE